MPGNDVYMCMKGTLVFVCGMGLLELSERVYLIGYKIILVSKELINRDIKWH